MKSMSRLPIRIKITLAFAGAMALVLVATGLFLYLRLGSELDSAIDEGLRSQEADVAALVQQSDSALREAQLNPLSGQSESLAQVLDRRNRIIDSTPQLQHTSLLTPAQLQRAQQGAVTFDQQSVTPSEGRLHLLAAPVQAQGRHFVVVVGASLEDRSDALASLARLLLIGGPAALLLASLAGYVVATGALRPVESMRRRAAAISAGKPGQRLPVPPGDDELARLGTTLNEMLERLERALERERSFVADASHELRSPLAILKTELEIALRRGRTVEELQAVVESAADETDRLVQLAEDLLVIARADQGQLPVRLERAEVREVFSGIRERFDRRLRDAGRPVLVDVVEPLEVVADRTRLEQALGSMVDNALRYGAGPIRMAAMRTDGRVELHVTDEGAGFPPDFIARAFERFTRADPARGRGGTGLGLAIVRAIASSHGGVAIAANLDGGGADVWISLPDRRAPGTAVP
jgi:heavy metal sensor kinase